MASLILTIEEQMSLVGFTDFEVSRNFQPSNQYTGADGSDSVKTRVFLHAITNPSLGNSRRYNSTRDKRADLQHLTKTVQVSVLHDYDYMDDTDTPAEDICATVRALLDSPDAIKSLRERGLFLESVTDLRPIFFVNDKDLNESSPNFDVRLTYRSDIIKDVSAATEVNGTIESDSI